MFCVILGRNSSFLDRHYLLPTALQKYCGPRSALREYSNAKPDPLYPDPGLPYLLSDPNTLNPHHLSISPNHLHPAGPLTWIQHSEFVAYVLTCILTQKIKMLLASEMQFRAFLHIHVWEFQQHDISKLLIFEAWSIQPKIHNFNQLIDICDEQVKPGPAMRLFNSLFLKQRLRYELQISK